MFSRSSDRTPAEDGRRGGLQPVAGAAGAPPATSLAATDVTVIAREDRVEGTVHAHKSIRVLGSAKGRLEAPSVTIEEGAKVAADVAADEVVVAGEYSGNMVCRQRLEVRTSGRLSGRIETLKLMLHEGAAVDGEVHMLKPAADEPAIRVTPSVRGYGEPAVRQPVSPGAEPIG
jgi:cytoskeletal protein CcmA (bactofilin family)